MTRSIPQLWLLFAGHADTRLAVRLDPVISKRGASLAYTPGPIGDGLDIELKTREDDNTPPTDAYRDLEQSAINGGKRGYDLLQSEGYLRCEATCRFQFEEKYQNNQQLHNVRGASADLLFGLAVVTAVRSDLDYPPFAATGILNEENQVLPVQGLRAKIAAALDISALHGNGLIFYPAANDRNINSEIDTELRYRAEQLQVCLFPVNRLEDAVERLNIPIKGTWTGNPYRHLDVFEIQHQRIFFGRENETDRLVEKLLQREKLKRPSLLILGPSGSGKSSLVQAGLIPELKRLSDRSLLTSTWDLRNAAKQNDVSAIVSSIRSSWALLPDLATLNRDYAPGSEVAAVPANLFTALAKDLTDRLSNQTCLVWVLDQLEQFFSLDFNAEEEVAFINFLHELQARGIWIVATFRNDFYSTLQAHDGLLSIFDKNGAHDLEKLSETAIERIIQKPAELAKVEFEYDDASSELLSLKLKNDALAGGKDILPLLEFALYQLYETRELRNGRYQMTFTAYKTMGGLQGAIGKRADDVLDCLDQEAQATLGRVLRALTTLRRNTIQIQDGVSSFVAKVANLESFPSGTPARHLIDTFASERQRLFMRDSDDIGNAQVRVTHEALLTHWPRAITILNNSIPELELRDRLTDRVSYWKSKNEEPSLLLQTGLPLAEAQDLLARQGDELDAEIVRYIEKSINAEQERQQIELKTLRRRTRIARISAVILGILLLVAIGAVYYADQVRNEQAAMLVNSYFSEGTRLVDEGRSKEALAYLARAIYLHPNADTSATRLTASLLLSPRELINISTVRIPCNYNMKTAQFSPDGRWVLAACGHIAQIWDAVSGKSVFPPMVHKSIVELAQFSSDGRHVVTISNDHIAQIWETTEGRPASPPMLHDNFVQTVQFSSDGHWLITASQDGIARVWEAGTGTLVIHSSQFDVNTKLAKFSPDGHWVIIGAKDGTTRVWDVKTEIPMSQPMQHEHLVHSAQFSPDGNRIATTAWNRVRVWDIATGLPVSQLMIHNDKVGLVQFSPDGRLVITTSNFSRTVQVWEVATGALVSQPMQHESVVKSAQFSPDGRWVVTASMDGTSRVWEVEMGELVSQPMRHNDSVNTVQFSPDGRRILTASDDGTAKIWEVRAGNSLHSLIGGKIGLTEFSPDGQWAITTSGDVPRVWKAKEGALVSQLVHQRGKVRLARFSPDNRWVVTASVNNSGDEINTIVQVWETATGVPVTQPIEQKAVLINSVQFSPDGRRIVIATSNKIAQVWDIATEVMVSQLQHGNVVSSAQFSSDGRRIVTSSWDDTSLIWDASTGARLSQPMQHEHSVQSAQFSPDDRWVVTVSMDQVRVWEAATGAPLSQPMHHGWRVKSAQFSPDGRWVLTASENRTAQIWEATTGKPVSSLMEHKNRINSAYFSPDGRWVITSSDDRTARVWEVTTGKPVSPELKHKHSVISAQFSPDGRWVVTSSVDKTVRIWDAMTGKPVSVLLKSQPTLPVGQAKFSPDNLRVMTLNAHVWEIPSISKKVGKGFTEFLERISGYAINHNSVLQEKHKDSTISKLRDWVENTTNITQEERSFINWWLSDPIDRTVTPTSKQTVKERIQMLIDHDTITSLNEALDYYPGHPMALAKLAAATWRDTKTDQQNDIRPRVVLWINLALKYAPDDMAVRAVAEKILQDIAQPN